MARARFAVMSLTDAAADRARNLIANAGKPIAGLRVGVDKGGCAGMAYKVEFAETINPLDEVVEDKGVKIFIESKSLMFLLGTVLDFETTKLASTFTFKNPNQISACGCGESVSITPAVMDAADAAHA
ncbi:iron-sulfur cluster assembly accessory protein [Beijerinckia sp. L45]|uniref:HesB/IscA family protein n=1 Tax=Beijerinckia sp. L45 TaxID=1641855 RepID=UPI00131C1715|nr:iron-sulfur cluster assembly accessory protein [Beijerinckia sp. L45]